jgi:hypothetical protein
MTPIFTGPIMVLPTALRVLITRSIPSRAVIPTEILLRLARHKACSMLDTDHSLIQPGSHLMFPTSSNIPAPVVRIGPEVPSAWPRNRAGVIEVANSWYDASRVAVNSSKIAALPAGEVTPPPAGETNLEIDTQTPLKDAAKFAIAMGSINHMFWSHDANGEFVRYEHNGKIGALAMSSAFEAAWQDPQSPIAQARDHHIPLTTEAITKVFGPIPDPDGRARILNEIFRPGSFGAYGKLESFGLYAEHAGVSGGLVFDTSYAARLADAFPQGYADEVLKKAQLATSAVWRSAAARGGPKACPELTAFADYQIPNVLRAMGMLDYTPELAARIDAGELIEANGPDERALRAASILAIEQLASAQGVGVADVDYWVWLKRKEPKTPFHLTVTTAY